MSRSLAWQAAQAAVVGRTCVPSPLTHPMPAGGPAACSLSRASRLLPAPCSLPELFWDSEPASVQAGGSPAPSSTCPLPEHVPTPRKAQWPSWQPDPCVPHLFASARSRLHKPAPFCVPPGLPTLSPSAHAVPWALGWHLCPSCALVAFDMLHPWLTLSWHLPSLADTSLHIQELASSNGAWVSLCAFHVHSLAHSLLFEDCCLCTPPAFSFAHSCAFCLLRN